MKSFFSLSVLLLLLACAPSVSAETAAFQAAYSFVDTENKPFSDKDFAGKYTVLSFFFSRCKGPCPTLNAKIQLLGSRLEGFGNVQVISISIDGDFDTPEVLAEYAKKFPGNSQRKFLTARPEVVQSFSENVFHYAADAKEEVHTTKVLLLGKDRQLLQSFDSEEAGFVDRIVKRIEQEIKK